MTIITPRDGEKVLFVIRKTIVRQLKALIKFLLLIIFGTALLFAVSNEIVSLVSISIIVFAFIYAFYHFFVWFYDVYIVTNQRIVSVEQRGVFSKEYSEVELTRVKDVTYSINGVLATIFRFGTVHIKSEESDIELKDLVDPDDAQEMIKKLSSEIKKEKGKGEMSAKELIELLTKSKK